MSHRFLNAGTAVALAIGIVACSKPAPLKRSANGESLYAVNCAICHGTSGNGDGPVGQTNFPPASRLNDAGFAAKADSVIIDAVKVGVSRAGKQTMPPAKGLSDEEIAALVKYVRSLAR